MSTRQYLFFQYVDPDNLFYVVDVARNPDDLDAAEFRLLFESLKQEFRSELRLTTSQEEELPLTAVSEEEMDAVDKLRCKSRWPDTERYLIAWEGREKERDPVRVRDWFRSQLYRLSQFLHREISETKNIHLLEEVVDFVKSRTGADTNSNENPMTTGEKRVWDALENRALSADQLVDVLDQEQEWTTSSETIRQHIKTLRHKGRLIPHTRGRGYWRKDAPPSDIRPAE